MSFRHIAMFRWAAHVTDNDVAMIAEALDELPNSVPTIRRYAHGADAAVAEENFDYAVVADFDDADGWRAYRDHPAHLALIETHIKPHLAERAAIQIADMHLSE